MNPTTQSFEYFGQHVPSYKPVRLAWLDQHGRIKCIAGRCIDITDKRVHLEVAEQVPLHTRLIIGAGGKHIAGSAVVKYVTRFETKFILVLETGQTEAKTG